MTAYAPLQTLSRATPVVRRDPAIDLLRAASLVVVVALHAMMVGVSVGVHGPLLGNALENQLWFAPVSWLVQVMPLFFLVGGFSSLSQWRRERERGTTAAGFVASRLHRLLVPSIAMLITVAIALSLMAGAGFSPELVATAGFRISQPLWFLGVYLVCQALIPVMVRIHEAHPALGLLALAAGIVAVDVVRLATGVTAIGFVNLAFVWLFLQQLGFWLLDGRIAALTARRRGQLAGLSAAVMLALVLTGLYSPDMFVNLNPPTVCMALLGIAQLLLVSLALPMLRRWCDRPAVARIVTAIGSRSMTIYLWHLPVLVALAGVLLFTEGSSLPAPLSLEWWLTRPAWLATAAVAVWLVVKMTARWEKGSTPRTAVTAPRVAVAALLGVAGVAILFIVGLTALTATLSVVAMLAALWLSRRLVRSGSRLDAVVIPRRNDGAVK